MRHTMYTKKQRQASRYMQNLNRKNSYNSQKYVAHVLFWNSASQGTYVRTKK